MDNDRKKLLIIKTGAAGDVVRTTTLLHPFRAWEIDWITAPENAELLSNSSINKVFCDPASIDLAKKYNLVVNLEDDAEYVARVFPRLQYEKLVGSFVDDNKRILYTPDAAQWFDMGLISRHGIQAANDLKLKNRRSYQEILFHCLGFRFNGEPYVMPRDIPDSPLRGDIAVAPQAGYRWPIKNWHFFDDLISALSKQHTVNVLPKRTTLLEHIADIKQHRLVISPDSLPMHLAMGLGIPGVAIFTCTSPWEIHDYGLLRKVISSKLDRYWYSREYHKDAVTCIPFQQVHSVVTETLTAYNIHSEVFK